jgi:transposase
MRPKRYIKLDSNEIITLEEGYKNVSHHQFRMRCHCLLLSNQGYDMASLKAVFQVTHATISNWFDGWERGGIAGLRNKIGQGPKFILNADDLAVIKAKVQENPQGLKQVRAELEVALNKQFSTETLQRFLKSLVMPVGYVGARV